jgi:hypothetical protein
MVAVLKLLTLKKKKKKPRSIGPKLH